MTGRDVPGTLSLTSFKWLAINWMMNQIMTYEKMVEITISIHLKLIDCLGFQVCVLFSTTTT